MSIVSEEIVKVAREILGAARKPISTEDMWKDYQELKSLYKVGIKHGVNASTVASRFAHAGLPVNPGPPLRPDISTDQIWRDYQELQSIHRVAKKYGIHPKAVTHRLKSGGYKLKQSPFRNVPTDQLWKDYQELKSTIKVADKYNTDSATVMRRLKAAGYPVVKLVREVDVDQLWKDYQELKSFEKVALKHDVSIAVVKKRLKDRLPPPKSKNLSGATIEDLIREHDAIKGSGLRKKAMLERLAKRFGVDPSAIRRRLQEAGVWQSPVASSPRDFELSSAISRFNTLVKAGVPQAKAIQTLAKELSISVSTLEHWFLRYKVIFRKKEIDWEKATKPVTPLIQEIPQLPYNENYDITEGYIPVKRDEKNS